MCEGGDAGGQVADQSAEQGSQNRNDSSDTSASESYYNSMAADLQAQEGTYIPSVEKGGSDKSAGNKNNREGPASSQDGTNMDSRKDFFQDDIFQIMRDLASIGFDMADVVEVFEEERSSETTWEPETDFSKYFPDPGDTPSEKEDPDKNRHQSDLEDWINKMKDAQYSQQAQNFVDKYLSDHMDDPGVGGEIARQEYYRRHPEKKFLA